MSHSQLQKKIKTKPKMLSVRLTKEQFDDLENMIRLIELETGTKVSRSSLVLKLIEFGRSKLESLYPVAFGVDKPIEVEFMEEKKKKKFLFFGS
ncbi:MAG: hypothetical protein R3B45_09920 [Bdellovibrionota bacterium]